MSRYRPRGVDRHAAEQLLSGASDSADASAPLVAVLRAASAPAHSAELAGEQAAVAAFLDVAELGPAPVSPRPSLFRTALAKLLTVKGLIVVAAAGSTGIVLAAAGVALPGPWVDTPADLPSVQTSVPETGPASAPESERVSVPASVTPTGRSSDVGRPPEVGGGPAPSMAGLCRAYSAQHGVNPGKALDSPAFGALVTAAGGVENVPEYCSDVTGEQPSEPARTDPGKNGVPSGARIPPARTQAPIPHVPDVAHPSGARTPSRNG